VRICVHQCPDVVRSPNWQCLEERDSGGDLVARYTYAPGGYIDDVAVQERDLNPDCERREQTGREPKGRVPKGCDGEAAHNGTVRYLWGGQSNWQCLEERDSGGDVVARYTYAPGYIDGVAVQERDLNLRLLTQTDADSGGYGNRTPMVRAAAQDP